MKNLKFIPITLAFVVGFSTCVIGQTVLEPISAFLNHGLTVEFNDVDQVMTDESGNKVVPITYNNTTYLPVRAVSNMLGVKVGWDQATQTVLLGESYPDNVEVGITKENLILDVAKSEIGRVCSGTCVFEDLNINYYPTNPDIVSVSAFAHEIGEESGWNETVYLNSKTGDVLWYDRGLDVDEGLEAFLLLNNLLSEEEKSFISINENLAKSIMYAYENIHFMYKNALCQSGDFTLVFDHITYSANGRVAQINFFTHDGSTKSIWPSSEFVDVEQVNGLYTALGTDPGNKINEFDNYVGE